MFVLYLLHEVKEFMFRFPYRFRHRIPRNLIFITDHRSMRVCGNVRHVRASSVVLLSVPNRNSTHWKLSH